MDLDEISSLQSARSNGLIRTGMTRTTITLSRLLLPFVAACLGAGLFLVAMTDLRDSDARAADNSGGPVGTDAPTVVQPAPDAAAELKQKRDQTRAELDALSKTISLSSDKIKELQDSVAALDKGNASLRQALIDSA